MSSAAQMRAAANGVKPKAVKLPSPTVGTVALQNRVADMAQLLVAAKLVNHCERLLVAGKPLPMAMSDELLVIADAFGPYLAMVEEAE